MNRRHALAAIASVLIWPSLVSAQQAGRAPVVGLLITHPPLNDIVVDYLRQGLQSYGYEDGRNIKIEVRTALGQLDRVPALADELVRLPVDIIVVVNDISVRAVMKATQTIPIVLVGFVNDPLAMGWIESYRRSGSNLTGVFSVDMSLGPKRLEILKEALPHVSRIAVLWDPVFGKRELEEIQGAALLLGVELIPIEVRHAQDLESALKATRQKKAAAAIITWSPVFWVQRNRVAAIYREAGLPIISSMFALTEAGGLLSYGSDSLHNWARAAYYIDRLLKGAKPAELPVEQPLRFKLMVNMKTANALGVKIPQSILLRADEVIR
jgi:ABC-type uncharacterized transport system substrate-binding protein